MSYMFSHCYSLTNLNLSNFNTNNVNNMSYMFSHCYSLTNLNLSNFNTNNVNYIDHIFSDLNTNCDIITNDNNLLNLLINL